MRRCNSFLLTRLTLGLMAVVVFLGAMPLPAAATPPAQLTAIHLARHSARDLQVIFSLNQIPDYRYFFLTNPDRVVIDFANTEMATTLPTALSSPLVTKIRSGNPKPQTFRIVLDLKEPVQIKNNANKRQIIFNMLPLQAYIKTAAAPKTAKIAAVPKTPDAPKAILPPKLVPTPKAPPPRPVVAVAKKPLPPQGRKVVVLIDPGHGGKDPGAVGKEGNHEKDVVLDIAKELARTINKQPGMKAVLSRQGDYYINLRNRLQIARQYKADVFVAIHADAFHNTYSSGASVYALSLKGASSEAARWLAAKENYSELGGVNLAGKNDVLRSVLIDLSQTATISASLELGQHVLQQMGQLAALHRTHVEQAPFMVLKSPDIPSILVETGFLSNPKEEQKLIHHQYQRQLAESIKDGIVAYVKQHPPPETTLALNAERKG